MRSGLAFDTNLLGSSLTRRLMALWMESSARSVVVLPTVAEELLRPNPHSTPRSRQLDEIYEGAWKSLWRESGSLYERRQLAADELEKAAAIHRSFTLRCFPRAADTGEIAQLNDAAIVAEAVATATTLLVTNNMNSIDHEEVNGLLAQQWGLNHDLLITADNALLTAHRCGEASRTLLTLFLAATWPADKPHLSVAECADTLKRCARGLSVGARMRNVAVRLHNAFDVDEDLEFVIDSAKTLVRTSPALKLDHARGSITSPAVGNFWKVGMRPASAAWDDGRGRRGSRAYPPTSRNAEVKASAARSGANSGCGSRAPRR